MIEATKFNKNVNGDIITKFTGSRQHGPRFTRSQFQATMPNASLHKEKFPVIIDFINESATFFMVSTFFSNTFFSSTRSLTKSYYTSICFSFE